MKTSVAAIALASMAVSVQGFAPQASRVSNMKLMASSIDDKTEVREYFNTEGFNRWNKIYSESDEVNSVQLDIRTGHDQTIQKILNWVEADGDIKGKSVCDCGCGVGSLAIPLAQMGEYKYLLNKCFFDNSCVSLLFVCVYKCFTHAFRT